MHNPPRKLKAEDCASLASLLAGALARMGVQVNKTSDLSKMLGALGMARIFSCGLLRRHFIGGLVAPRLVLTLPGLRSNRASAIMLLTGEGLPG
jgi:hypothetical protein